MCEISWIDKNGKLTPDNNAPVGKVRCRTWKYAFGQRSHPDGFSRWFDICHAHFERLAEPDMGDWEFEPAPDTVGYSRIVCK